MFICNSSPDWLALPFDKRFNTDFLESDPLLLYQEATQLSCRYVFQKSRLMYCESNPGCICKCLTNPMKFLKNFSWCVLFITKNVKIIFLVQLMARILLFCVIAQRMLKWLIQCNGWNSTWFVLYSTKNLKISYLMQLMVQTLLCLCYTAPRTLKYLIQCN